MEYEMEELVPIVGKLAEKYTAGESSSITYEKAEQLMGAVIYCIRELEQAGESKKSLVQQSEKLPAKKAYEMGYQLVVEKVGRSMTRYNEIAADFEDYGNRCLRDTVLKGMPEFFKWYDTRFHPQNTMLTLDYPILRDITSFHGIDAIHEYLRGIQLEQLFLKKYDREQIKRILSEYDPLYQSMIDNICYPILKDAIAHFDLGETKEKMGLFLTQFVKQYYEENTALLEYLKQGIPDIWVRYHSCNQEGKSV